ncbi:putative ubiquitin carboxyl-terminal hydrolase [Cafeteria roenbergensis virus]|uniref:ubiquitinyl hydrolase 1 n=1 Tax=Cafeteria roenbergensis virus (strain BV-PW1) TaxID=693272 RepID=E3T5M8_CROVB|nr:putative ubiquitin carboxyl-terminal hydrolase [Cafeteria roenbergensis virus BV-PW1]ADO67491.1 putative ubiquitin carboxyl-terminal hydrolase [Cafeteria roenbergensis virus BV-PW1]
MSLVNYSRLGNLGNTCYQNAVLHPLIHTPGGFIEFVMSGHYLDCMEEKKHEQIYQTLIFQFHRILNSIFKNNNSRLDINTWKKLVGEKNVFFEGSEQQDAHEFLSYIIDKMAEEVGTKIKFVSTKKINIDNFTFNSKLLNIQADNQWNKFLHKKYSIMIPLFTGMFRTKLTYLDSNAQTNNFVPFNVFPLPIPQGKDEVGLVECLKEFNKDEKLDKENLVKGKLSYGKSFAQKQESIWKLPKYLIFNLKRFKYNNFGQISTKDSTLVKYPLELDMKHFIDSESKYNKLEHKYQLYGITLHHGVMMGGFSAGHYVSYVKNRTDNNWYLYNDDHTPIKIEPTNIINSSAYLLFYARKD